jgi:hypothetical protein
MERMHRHWYGDIDFNLWQGEQSLPAAILAIGAHGVRALPSSLSPIVNFYVRFCFRRAFMGK